jgi:hypothetical protein
VRTRSVRFIETTSRTKNLRPTHRIGHCALSDGRVGGDHRIGGGAELRTTARKSDSMSRIRKHPFSLMRELSRRLAMARNDLANLFGLSSARANIEISRYLSKRLSSRERERERERRKDIIGNKVQGDRTTKIDYGSTVHIGAFTRSISLFIYK